MKLTVAAMGWADWMVPELSLSAEAQVEISKRVLLEQARQHPEEIAKLCGSLIEQNARLQTIIRKATGRIAELEIGAALLADAVEAIEDLCAQATPAE